LRSDQITLEQRDEQRDAGAGGEVIGDW
jgi:hypothetical protein